MTFLTRDHPFIQIGKVMSSIPFDTSLTKIALNQAPAADDGRTARRYFSLITTPSYTTFTAWVSAGHSASPLTTSGGKIRANCSTDTSNPLPFLNSARKRSRRRTDSCGS